MTDAELFLWSGIAFVGAFWLIVWFINRRVEKSPLPLCNFTNCVAGCGLICKGKCIMAGEPDNPNCEKFTPVTGD